MAYVNNFCLDDIETQIISYSMCLYDNKKIPRINIGNFLNNEEKSKVWYRIVQFYSVFFCFDLVSGECSAFALFQTVVKLLMLHYSFLVREYVQFQALFYRVYHVYRY